MLSRHEKLDGDPEAMQQIEFIGQQKYTDDAIVANESMFV